MHKRMEGTRIALLINRSQGSYKQLLQPSINLLTWRSSPRTSYESKSPNNKLKKYPLETISTSLQ